MIWSISADGVWYGILVIGGVIEVRCNRGDEKHVYQKIVAQCSDAVPLLNEIIEAVCMTPDAVCERIKSLGFENVNDTLH